MDDRTLYATILGIAAPWEVTRVELDDRAKAVHVWLEEQRGASFVCPECQTAAPLYDHVERSWRHLDTCQYEMRLHARVPRIECLTHGVKTVAVAWATAHSRFTLLFERLAIAWLKEATPAAVARRLGLTWEEANGIVERAVRRGLARRRSVAGRRLGIDEHSYLKHFEFVTMVVDLDEQIILHVANDRTAETLASYFESLSIDERLAIEAIAMDMWDPYRRTVRDYVPDGDLKIVFDKFHVMRHVIEAMDQVRRREQRELRASRRPSPDRHEISLAEDEGRARRFHRRESPAVPRAPPQHLEVRAGVGDERSLSPHLGVSLDRRRSGVLRSLAGVGRAVATEAHDPRRRDYPSAYRECAQLHQPSDHECGDRRAQRKDPMDQVLVARVSGSGAV